MDTITNATLDGLLATYRPVMARVDPWQAYGADIARRLWRAIPIAPPGGCVARHGMKKDTAKDFERNRGKVPGRWTRAGWTPLAGWRRHGVPTAGDLQEFGSWPDAGVGLILGPQGDGTHVVAVDCDVTDAALAGEIDDIAIVMLGAGARRVGRAPKWARLYRVSALIEKAVTDAVVLPFDCSDSKPHRVEVLGAGQQIVAYGQHPAGGAYHWPDEVAPHNTAPTVLPLITPDSLHRFLAAATRVLLRVGVIANKGSAGRDRGADNSAAAKPRTEYRAQDLDLCIEAARTVDLSDMSRDEWVAFAHALKGALGDTEDARDLWVSLTLTSRKSSGDPTAALRVWESIADSAVRSGAGTIFHIAREQGWTPPPGRDFDLVECDEEPPAETRQARPLDQVQTDLAAMLSAALTAGRPAKAAIS